MEILLFGLMLIQVRGHDDSSVGQRYFDYCLEVPNNLCGGLFFCFVFKIFHSSN